ncbi:MAG: VOC family protein [Undibacterium umbellatum]|uniref:VOC family protein n=1 Tax=Undibacterium umbellatum TaxID=2762300 RepID=UPI003BB50B82
MKALFHLAYHVRDLDEARQFYTGVLGCAEGRSTATWVDFDFFGHQISLHLGQPFTTTNTGQVDDHMVPMPHLGVILSIPEWQVLADRLLAQQIKFVLEPAIRFAGQPGEQATMFFLDPSGNPIEIKGFNHLDSVYDK